MRVHFTTEDIARVRVAPAPDPLWEIAHSFQILITKANPVVFSDWRRHVRSRLTPVCGLLGPLFPPQGYFPDFLTPELDGSVDLNGALDAVLSTPRTVLRDDLYRLATSTSRRRPLPAVVRSLADGTADALRHLGTALRAYYDHALARFWPRIRAQVDADLALRMRAALMGGTDGLLESFRPMLRWRPPLLEADYPVDRDLRLDGRGLLLQPSFFCVRRPITLASEELRPILVYPIQHTLGWARESGAVRPGAISDGGAELAALIGSTRAAILRDVVTGRNTSELAARFGITAAAVSQHAAVLRRSGLVLSVRRSRHVLHTITPTGVALLHSPPGTSTGRPSAHPLAVVNGSSLHNAV